MVDGHTSIIRSGLPTPTWRKLYGGVQPDKSRTVKVKDTTGMLEAYAEIDKALADLNNNSAEFRLSEDRAHIEGISQELAETIFFGNEGTEPEAFTGLSPRYNNLAAENADNIIDAGGVGPNNASIWLVVWGPSTVHGIFPKGLTAGITHRDMGEVTIEDVDGQGGRMQAYRSHYKLSAGLTLKDWRYVVRICNIDKNNLSIRFNDGAFVDTDGTTLKGPNLPDLMYQAMRVIPSMSRGRAAWYMSRDIATTFSQQLSHGVQNSTLTVDNQGGDKRYTERWHGIPIRRVDALAADEAQVV